MAIRTRHSKVRFCIVATICILLVCNVSNWMRNAKTLRPIEFRRREEIGKRRMSWYLDNKTFPLDEECLFVPDAVRELDCKKLYDGDEEYVKDAWQRRILLPEAAATFPTDCVSVHSRGCYTGYPLSQEEADFPIAYAIVVYKDYILIESILNAIFSPQNHYCYALDSKANSVVKRHLKALASCFPNVHVLDEEFFLDSYGHNMNAAFLACYEHLLTKRGWKYVISIQNHDMPLRTNRDIVRILTVFNGSNDVEVTRPNRDRIPRKKLTGRNKNESPLYSWTLESLKIVKNRSLPLNESEEMTLTKGGTATTLSREFIKFVLRDLDITELLRRLNERDYTDEMLFSSLHASDSLKAPGGYTAQCIIQRKTMFARGITRVTHWYDQKHCLSNYTRHNICIQGLENLVEMERRHGLFINKFLPDFDYGGIVCHLKRLMLRKMNPNEWPTAIDTEYYADLPAVRLNNLRKRQNAIDFKTFDCSLLGKDSIL